MAQALEISPEHESVSVDDLDHQSRVQLWAALVTNDWLQIPLQAGHSGLDRVNAGSGFPEYAFQFDEDGSAVQPLQYQFILAKLSLTLRVFYEHLVHSGGDYTVLASATLSADHDLATIVSQLPGHLQPEAHLADGPQNRSETYPWLFWQRENLCVILLYYRLVIYRPLCDIANKDEAGRSKAFLVCLDAAHSILASIQEFDSGDPIRHRRLVWYGSYLL
ncbi:hypothetical protein NW762_011330 [Fusarium torreyae]|uniref:Transcription factor domain-containing protein n=1 Tax=Fusarium torreyae TaxID=1237075 RepID=A0A9W8V9P2_9HYPO|nr:hypothetical protein NW762_011330 [Fusarium torreyae]